MTHKPREREKLAPRQNSWRAAVTCAIHTLWSISPPCPYKAAAGGKRAFDSPCCSLRTTNAQGATKLLRSSVYWQCDFLYDYSDQKTPGVRPMGYYSIFGPLCYKEGEGRRGRESLQSAATYRSYLRAGGGLRAFCSAFIPQRRPRNPSKRREADFMVL